jgi:hypothetical protein
MDLTDFPFERSPFPGLLEVASQGEKCKFRS